MACNLLLYPDLVFSVENESFLWLYSPFIVLVCVLALDMCCVVYGKGENRKIIMVYIIHIDLITVSLIYLNSLVYTIVQVRWKVNYWK